MEAEPTIRVKRLLKGGRLPERAHNSAGYDLFTPDPVMLQPRQAQKVPIGIAVEFPVGYAALIWDRSGMGSKGIHRFAGVIDADYRGEWAVVLYNATDSTIWLEPGQKVAQVLFQKVESWPVVEVEELTETSRGEGGFGSTGK